ncbi:MAG: hypothetical protein LBM19_00250 [Holosporales bacterium]|jgi:hypothetical protein|nr:hypothetical protein [Holosporales bacterium]
MTRSGAKKSDIEIAREYLRSNAYKRHKDLEDRGTAYNLQIIAEGIK